MRLFTPIIILIMMLALMAGCSSGGNVPVAPTNDMPQQTLSPTENPFSVGTDEPVITLPDYEIPKADYSDLAEGQVTEDPSGILYAGILELDRENGTITDIPSRDVMYNYDITGFLMAGYIRYTIISIVGDIWTIDVRITNPTSIIAYDVRQIFTALGNKKITNLDGYTDLFDPSGGPTINPFIAFAKTDIIRMFPIGPGEYDTQRVIIKWPTGDPPTIQYIVTASLPNNTEEPYTIYGFQQLGSMWWQGGTCNLTVKVEDWQWDLTSVQVDTRVFNNQVMYLAADPEHPNIFEAEVTNSKNAYPGTYPTLFKATSPNQQGASMYNIFNVVVTGPPQTPPVCDFYVSPEMIYPGQTTTLYPGPGIHDPEGNAIVLYEFDFFYNDGIFNTMASNTTGAPVTSPPAPYLGPNNFVVTMALRITDNGAPPMSSICTDTVTISGNQAPVCELVVNPAQIKSGQTTTLKPGTNCKDPDGTITLYEYDFNYDGTNFTTDASNTTGAQVTTSSYSNPGPNPLVVKVALRVTDNGSPGLKSTCWQNLTIIANTPPVCDLVADPITVPNGGTTTLRPGPLCADPDGNIVLYEYDFDYDGVTFDVNGSNATGNPVTTTAYNNPGPGPMNVTVAMRITDNGTPAAKVICTKVITVVINQNPICELVLSAYEINSGQSVDCSPGASTHDPDGSIVLYEYDFDYDGTNFTIDGSNTTGAPVATGPIDNTSGLPITRKIAMRVTDNGTPAAKSTCTKDLLVNPIMIAQNPWRNPAIRVTPSGLNSASIDRDRMENNLCVYGNNVYVAYFGKIDNVEGFYIQRSTNGGVTFNAPQKFSYSVRCTSCRDNDFITIDTLANGWVGVFTASYYDNCTNTGQVAVRFTICKPNGSGGVDIGSPIILSRAVQGHFSTQPGDGFQSVDIVAHPTDPNICFIDTIDLDNTGGSDGPDDLSLWKITNITTTPVATLEFTVVPPLSGSPPESGSDKAHVDAACDYNGNLHVVWCSRDLGTIYYSMVYGNTAYPFQFTQYEKINDFGELYPEGAHVAIDNNNVAYITYAATGIPGEIEPQEIGMLTGVGYPPTFPNAPFILNHDRAGNQVYPDIKFDQTTGDLWVAYTTFTYGPGQITFELYDAVNGWTQFQPDYFINKDDQTHQHNDEHVHLKLDSTTGTAYAIWMETSGTNSPHIYFNRTN
jgi:hypothetical protein